MLDELIGSYILLHLITKRNFVSIKGINESKDVNEVLIDINPAPDKKLKSVDIAYEAIKSAILSGELKSGDNLPETEFAKKFGISRTPLREALNQLKHDGLVVIERYSRSFVAHFEESDVQEIYELRARLESFAAGKAAVKIDEKGLSELHEIIVETDQVIDQFSDKMEYEFKRLNMKFHRLIWESACLPRTLRVLENSLAVPFNVLDRIEGNLKETLQRAQWYHKEIYFAIKVRDPIRAEAQMRAHIFSISSRDFI